MTDTIDEQLPPSDKPAQTAPQPEIVAVDYAEPHSAYEEGDLPDEDLIPEIADDPTIVSNTSADPLSEDMVDEEQEVKPPPVPPYKGEYKPQPNVTLPLDMFDDRPAGSLDEGFELPNFDLSELNTMRERVYAPIFAAQRERHEASRKNPNGPYIGVPLADKRILLLTEEESNTIDLISAQLNMLRKAAGHGLFEGEGDGWTNLPKHNEKNVAILSLNAKEDSDPLSRMRSEMGLSIKVPVPLWNSGFQVEIRTQPAIEGLGLETRMAVEKLDRGRETGGQVFAAPSVYMVRTLADHLLKYITTSTAGSLTVYQYKKIIKITDLETLALGAVAANHPQGFPYTRTCLDSEGGCREVVKRRLQPRRMLVGRRSRVTDGQMNQLSKRSGHIDHKSIIEYQNSLRPEISRLIRVRGKTHIRLAVPSIATHERIAGNWMEALTDTAKQLVPSNANEQERELYLIHATAISQVMAYASWIEAVVEYDPDSDGEPLTVLERLNNSDDLEAVNKADAALEKFVTEICDDPNNTKVIAEGIEKFINDMSLSAVVVEKTPCPACGREPKSENPKLDHPHVIQMDAIELFFTQLHLKIRKASGF